MTYIDALRQAQDAYPLDLVKRVRYIRYHWDNCDADDMRAWEIALRITRTGR